MPRSTTAPQAPGLRWFDPLLLATLPPLAATFLRAWMGTCRLVHVEGLAGEREALARSGHRAVYAAWHQRMAYHFYYSVSRRPTTLISQSRDGEYARRVAHWLGFPVARGSSTRGGLRALRELTALIRRGARAGILADGPQGPPRVAKAGAVLLARDAGVPILPVAWGCDRALIFNSWDRYLVPKPFARVVVYHGAPLWVPPGARGAELEHYRLMLEERLNQATLWCDAYFHRSWPWRRTSPRADTAKHRTAPRLKV